MAIQVGAPGSTSTFFASTAIACFAYAAVALLLLHALRTDYKLTKHMISDYAVGPYGWIMTTVFLALSCGCLALVFGLFRSGLRSVVARLGLLLLGVVSIGLLVSAMFPTDIAGAPATHTGSIHTISFLVNIVGIILATALLSASFGSQTRWRPYRPTAVTLTILVVLAFAFQFVTLFRRGAPYGIANRIFVVALLLWFLSTSVHLRALAHE